MAAIDPWHYPRETLADRHLALIAGGLANALVLFGPRRTGKTEFLLQDLAPAAERAGHRVVYASFWQSPLSPAGVLLHALESARGRGSLAERLRTLAGNLAPRLRIAGNLAGAEAEAEIDLTALSGPAPSDILLVIDTLLGRLARPGKPAILLLDEVQELAADAANRPLVAALRTGLDRRRDGLATVFTGSSRDGLAAMFSRREAPFFHFATSIDLPPLDDGFVDHLLAAFAAATGAVLDREAALATFAALHRNPFFFRKLLELLLSRSRRDIKAALGEVQARLSEELGYDRQWLGLSALQRAVLHALAGGSGEMAATRPFAAGTRAAMGAVLGTEPPSTPQVQAAIRRLVRLGLVSRADRASDYAFEDPEFARWVRSRPREAL
jgi:hypothetical protein